MIREKQMSSYRKTATVVGALFIIATAAGVASLLLTMSALGDVDYLTSLSESQSSVIIGGLLELTMAVAVAGTAIAIYPVFRRLNPALALGYVGARILEGTLFVVSVICLLVLLTLSGEYVKAGSPDTANIEMLGTLLLAARDWINNAIIPTFAFGLSMVIFYYVLYQSRLVPRWLSVWGLVGMPLYIAAGLSSMATGGSMLPAWNLLMIPIAINEMVLAAWLIVKGFESSAIDTLRSMEDKYFSTS